MNANARVISRLNEAHPEVAESLRLAHEEASRDQSPLTVTHLAHELLKTSSVRRCLGSASLESLPKPSPPTDGVPGQVAFDLSDLLGRASDRASKWNLERADAACILAEALVAPELAGASLRPEALAPRHTGRAFSPFGFGRDLTEEMSRGGDCPVRGMLDEYRTLLAALLARRAPVLLADPGVGKTHLMKGLAWHLVHGTDDLVPASLRRLRIVAVSRLDLLAGTQDRGRLEKRLKRLFNALAADETIVPFFDEAHALLSGGDDAGVAVANAIKERLSVNGLRLVLATTPAEYYRHVSADEALASRVVPIVLKEPDESRVLAILESAPHHHLPEAVGPEGVVLTPAARAAAYRISEDHRPGLHQPRNSVALLIDAIGDKFYQIQTGRTQTRELTAEDVARAFSVRSGVPLDYLLADPAERAARLSAGLTARVRGQEGAIAAVVGYLRSRDAGFGGTTRPRGTFLFIGPDGVGKSLLAESLATDKASLFRLSLGTSGQTSASEIRGAAPGYIGFGSTATVYAHVAVRPASVVVVEGLARTDGTVAEALKEVMEGRGKDASGREADFRQAIFCLIAPDLDAVPASLLERIGCVVRFDPLDETAMLLALGDRIADWRASSRSAYPEELDDVAVRSEIVSRCMTEEGGNARLLDAALIDWYSSR